MARIISGVELGQLENKKEAYINKGNEFSSQNNRELAIELSRQSRNVLLPAK